MPSVSKKKPPVPEPKLAPLAMPNFKGIKGIGDEKSSILETSSPSLQFSDASAPPASALKSQSKGVSLESHETEDSDTDTAGSIMLRLEPFKATMSGDELYSYFSNQNEVQTVAVVKNEKPIGIVTRNGTLEKFSRLYFRELFGKKEITEIMDKEPLVVERGLGLDELSEAITRGGQRYVADGFVVTDQGKYVGMGTSQALLRELTERKEALLAAALDRASEALRAANEELLEKQRMQQELAVAQEIQVALLPKEHPQIPGYQIDSLYKPALELGGDYFDFIPLPGRREAFVVADVSGKGVPASLGMTMARTVLRAHAHFDLSPAETLKKVNQVITPDFRPGMFITLFYAVLDPLAHNIQCVCAGHNPAYHVRPGVGIQGIMPEGMALGLPPELYYVQELDVKMAPGDLLVFYTDGVTEAMNAKEEEYGEDRFMDSIHRHASGPFDKLIESLLNEIQDFCGDFEQSDDITLMILRRLPEA